MIVSNTTAIGVGTGTEEFDDPSTSDNWTSGETAVEWGLDVNHDGEPDFIAVMFNDAIDGFGVIAGVVDGSGSTELSAASPDWDATDNGYLVQFTRSCVDSPAKVQVQGFVDYETTSTSSTDITNWSAVVVPSVPKPPPVVKQTPVNGYWMLGADGHVYGFGAAVSFGGRGGWCDARWLPVTTARVTGSSTVAATCSHTAPPHSSVRSPSLGAAEIVSAISATPNSGRLLVVHQPGSGHPVRKRRVLRRHVADAHLNGPIVASVATASGTGYYIVGSDGGDLQLRRRQVPRLDRRDPPQQADRRDLADRRRQGLLARRVPTAGCSRSRHRSAVRWAAPSSTGRSTAWSAFGNGYLMAASDGGIFDFSNKAFDGSLANNPPSAPIIGLAAVSS